MISTDNWNERELDLFDAYIAGFDASGEGFNGEYVGHQYKSDPENFRQRLLLAFQTWRNAS